MARILKDALRIKQRAKRFTILLTIQDSRHLHSNLCKANEMDLTPYKNLEHEHSLKE